MARAGRRSSRQEETWPTSATAMALTRANSFMESVDYSASCGLIGPPDGRGDARDVRALGVDYGERRIGLALSDPTGLLASPWKTVVNAGEREPRGEQLVDEARRLSAEETASSPSSSACRDASTERRRR